ncbi:putative 39S ribosomal protein L24, mitochondrial [Nymphon striatum]|nr:putative 39S ribosomal protein L24, mitochondrial [Nymphon striatum]
MRLSCLLRCVSKLPKNYGNFPESFIKKKTESIEWKTPKGPQYRPAVIKRRSTYHYLSRPWEQKFTHDNSVKHPKIFVEPIKDFFMFNGDIVEILVGKDKGKQGKICYIVKERNFICVEGLNCVYSYLDPETKNSMYKDEMPLLINTEVRLVDPSDKKPTTIQWRYTEEGEKVRVSTRTGRIIPLPQGALITRDYKTKDTYEEQIKDTKAEDVLKVSFQPKLKTFEQDIMEEQSIKEDKIPTRLYWY